MVLEIRVSVGGANHTILNRRWRDLISLEAALVRERMLRGPLMLATGRTVTAEARRAAADAFLARLVNNADALPPHSLLEFLDIADAAAVVGTAQTQRFTMEQQQQQQQQQQPARALPPAPRVQLFSRSAWAEQRRGGSRCGKPPTASTLIAAPSPEVVPSGPGSVNHGNHRDDRLTANNPGVRKPKLPPSASGVIRPAVIDPSFEAYRGSATVQEQLQARAAFAAAEERLLGIVQQRAARREEDGGADMKVAATAEEHAERIESSVAIRRDDVVPAEPTEVGTSNSDGGDGEAMQVLQMHESPAVPLTFDEHAEPATRSPPPKISDANDAAPTAGGEFARAEAAAEEARRAAVTAHQEALKAAEEAAAATAAVVAIETSRKQLVIHEANPAGRFAPKGPVQSSQEEDRRRVLARVAGVALADAAIGSDISVPSTEADEAIQTLDLYYEDHEIPVAIAQPTCNEAVAARTALNPQHDLDKRSSENEIDKREEREDVLLQTENSSCATTVESMNAMGQTTLETDGLEPHATPEYARLFSSETLARLQEIAQTQTSVDQHAQGDLGTVSHGTEDAFDESSSTDSADNNVPQLAPGRVIVQSIGSNAADPLGADKTMPAAIKIPATLQIHTLNIDGASVQRPNTTPVVTATQHACAVGLPSERFEATCHESAPAQPPTPLPASITPRVAQPIVPPSSAVSTATAATLGPRDGARQAKKMATVAWQPPNADWENVRLAGSSCMDAECSSSGRSSRMSDAIEEPRMQPPPSDGVEDHQLRTGKIWMSRENEPATEGQRRTPSEGAPIVERSAHGAFDCPVRTSIVRRAVLTAAAMPHEALMLEYSSEVSHLHEERHRFQRAWLTEQKKSQTLLKRVQHYACVQIVQVLSHSNRFAVAHMFYGWVHFGSTDAVSGDGPSPNTPGLVATRTASESRQSNSSPTDRNRSPTKELAIGLGALASGRRGKGFRKSRRDHIVQAIDEVLAERGEDKTTELLVSWKNNSYARPSWTLLTELKKNPTNIGVIAEYYETGQRTIEEVDINELEQET